VIAPQPGCADFQQFVAQGKALKNYLPLPARYCSLAASQPGSVLLQTARFDAENYRSYLFLHPERTLAAGPALFDEIEQALAQGSYVAGYFAYECGEGLKEMVRPAPQHASMPPVWLGVYAHAFVFDHRTGCFEGELPEAYFASDLPHRREFEIRNLRFDFDERSYAGKIETIQEYIRSGHTYQVNFTGQLRFDFSGSPEALFAALAENQQARYCAFLNGENWLVLSFSPELFFRVAERSIITRPMKGTARRGVDCAEDESLTRWLQSDAKNCSENVMIVDLLRNDLGRICEFGSIRVEELCAVEKYQTLFQMTSTVSGTLRAEVRAAAIFASLFPCGSVTGAPKHRTMQIIRELERGPRGVYTGAIGFFSPTSEAVFSVPIRTVVLEGSRGSMGVGSGIVIDSRADEEFRECLLKSEFLTRREADVQLLESILWNDGYFLLPLHLERMESSAAYFGFPFDVEAVLAALVKIELQCSAGARIKVRLLLARTGVITVTHAALEEREGSGRVMVSALRVVSTDRFLRHKTTRRQLYDQQYNEALRQGYDEVLFLNERGELTEGAISNLFIEKDGRWRTPPVACGVLPGVYRRHLLETRDATEEQIVRLEDLDCAEAVYLCNSVRGCRKITVDPLSNS
jgi:para-aminobenzoate synthetase/4-amino-4-deoxychorismate lyase